MELTAFTTPPTPVTGQTPKRRKTTSWAIAFSAGIHLVIGAFFVFGDFQFNKAIDLDKNIVQTRLVKLGKERKKEWLPRKSQPKPKPKANPAAVKPKPAKPKPTPPQKTVAKAKPKPKTTPAKKPDPAPSVDRQQQMSDALSKLQAAQATDLNQLIQDKMAAEEDEGQANGSVLGTEVSGEMEASYNGLLSAHIRGAFELPTVLTDAERMRLRAHLAIRIGPNGELLAAKVTQSSGNAAFDNSVLAAAQKSVPLPSPPLVLRALYRKGVTLEFCPIRCE
ncbi:MAG: hypothetical protein CMH56_00710 [Myxococcales bacterium]|nr:hypothetical protein [Myxococcales bacterium]